MSFMVKYVRLKKVRDQYIDGKKIYTRLFIKRKIS